MIWERCWCARGIMLWERRWCVSGIVHFWRWRWVIVMLRNVCDLTQNCSGFSSTQSFFCLWFCRKPRRWTWSSHSGLIAVTLRFEPLLVFAVLDLDRSFGLLCATFQSFLFVLLCGGSSPTWVSLLFLRLFGGCHSNKLMILTRYQWELNLTTTFEPSAPHLRSPKLWHLCDWSAPCS